MKRGSVVQSLAPLYLAAVRAYSTGSPDKVDALMSDLLSELGEARELIADARESRGSVYFAEDLDDAIKKTDEVLASWKALQKKLSVELRAAELEALQRKHAVAFKQLSLEIDEVIQMDDE